MDRQRTDNRKNLAAAALALLLALALLVATAPSALTATSDPLLAAGPASGSTAAVPLTGSTAAGAGYGEPDPESSETPTSETPTSETSTPATDTTAAGAGYGKPSPGSSAASTILEPLAAAAATVSDSTPPLISGITPADGSITGTSVFLAASYSDPEPSSGIRTTTAMIHIDNRHQYGCTITESSISLQKTGLTEGSHKIEAFICDNVYNCSVATWYITVDATAPAISGNQPTGIINTTSTTISSTFNDSTGVDPASAQVLIDGADATAGCLVTAAGASCPVSGLSEGIHTIQVAVSDLAGNRGAASWSFTVNSSVIGITGQSPPPGSWQTSSSAFIGAVFQQTASGIIDTSSITVTLDGHNITADVDRQGNGISFTPPSLYLSEGWHTVSVSVQDNAGYSGQSEWSFAVDTVPPAIENETPTGSTTGQPAIHASFSDSGSGIDLGTVELSVDGINQTGAATVAAGEITFLPTEGLPPGPHNVQLSIADIAGNRQLSAWSFSVPAFTAPAGSAGYTTPGGYSEGTTTVITEYWESYSTQQLPGVGGWNLSGIRAFPSTYYLPWYGADPAAGIDNDEILIRNQGAGEAVVNIFIGGVIQWEGKIPEGGDVASNMPGITGGPVEIICPTGQQLEVVSQVTSRGAVSRTPGVPQDALEPVLILPWYSSPPAGQGTSSLTIANAGDMDAAVDVYVGDPSLPESLKGHYSIKPDTAAVTDLPGTTGGPVRIVCTNGQPLVADYRETSSGVLSRVNATALSLLGDSYHLQPDAGASGKPMKLIIGNGNSEDKLAALRINGREFAPDVEDASGLPISANSATVIDLGVAETGPVDVSCDDCSLGEGLTVWLTR